MSVCVRVCVLVQSVVDMDDSRQRIVWTNECFFFLVDRSICFSQFVTFLDLIKWRLEKAGFKVMNGASEKAREVT